MTDEQIKKALKYCQDTEGDSCQCCEYLDVSGCQIELLKDALDLINRQQAEVKELKKEKYRLQKALNQAEDYRLIAKAEAIKECLEWVLSLFPEDKDFTTISRFTINQKLKEMVGEQE